MSWALRRRLIVIGLIAAVIAGALSYLYFGYIRSAPSCMDHTQNHGEEGIDCGGTCTYLCTASESAPSVRFVRPVSPAPGRTDVIAYVDNPNTNAAAKDLHFTVELYDAQNVLVAKKDGALDLPPAATVPVFIPNLATGNAQVAHAFLTLDTPEHEWYRYQDTRTIPTVSDVSLTPGQEPRITAVAHNPSARPIDSTVFVVTLFNGEGNAIAASRTVASLPAQGTAQLVFTWPNPFPGDVSRVEVNPVVPLPSP